VCVSVCVAPAATLLLVVSCGWGCASSDGWKLKAQRLYSVVPDRLVLAPKFILFFCRMLADEDKEGNRKFAQTAWNILNDRCKNDNSYPAPHLPGEW